MHVHGIRVKAIYVAFLLAGLGAGAARFDRWEVIGPGGGGGNFLPTISPHDTKCVLVSCDMTGAYISQDTGHSWRMFNLGDGIWFFLFDPVDPQAIYVKTRSGPPEMNRDRPAGTPALWRSTDSGRTWRLVYRDSPGDSITALAIDPADSTILYAAFQGNGLSVLRASTDQGKKWNKLTDLPDGADRIYIDPRSARSDRTLYVIGISSVTVREGGHWHTGEALRGVEHIAGRPELHGRVVSAGFPNGGGKLVVYAVAAAGLVVSDNGGQTWRNCSLSALSPSRRLVAVATSLNHPDVAYLSWNSGRRGAESLFGVAKTTDRGRTWELVWKESTTSAPNVHDFWMSERFGPGWGGNPIYLGVAPTDPNICFGTDNGRTLRTTDGGRTWEGAYSTKLPDGTFTSTGLDVTTNYGVHFDPFDPKRIFISYTDIGLFRSENGGKSWFDSASGVPARWTNTAYWMAFDPQVRGRVWAAMSGTHDLPRPKMWMQNSPAAFTGGVCRSEDGARTWDCSSEGMPQTAATHILLDPQSPPTARVLYVAGFGRGVFKSADGGNHWALKNNGIAGSEPLAWRLARDANGAVYLVVARRNDDGSIGGDGDGAVYRSTDGAEHWTKITLPEGTNGPSGLAVDSQDPQRLYLAAWGRRPESTTMGGGIFLSTNGGGAWRQVLAKDQHVYDVTADPRNPKILYACGFESSAWRSADRGESWQRIPGYNFKFGHRVIPDPADTNRIYITTYGGGVWHGPAAGDKDAREDIQGNR